MLLIIGGILILVEVLFFTVWGAAISLVELLWPVLAIGMIAAIAKQLLSGTLEGAKSTADVICGVAIAGLFVGIIVTLAGLLWLFTEGEPGIFFVALLVTIGCFIVARIAGKIARKKEQKVSDEKIVKPIQKVQSTTVKNASKGIEETAPLAQEDCWWEDEDEDDWYTSQFD